MAGKSPFTGANNLKQRDYKNYQNKENKDEQSEKIENHVYIPFNATKQHKSEKLKFKDKIRKYSGYASVVITTVSPLHIGSGFCSVDRDGALKDVQYISGKAVIPGSSLKGCIRNNARMAADGCKPHVPNKPPKGVPENEFKRYRFPVEMRECRDSNSEHCIICDMFGMLGKGKTNEKPNSSMKSRIFFDDFTADKYETKSQYVPQPFGPSLKKSVDAEYNYKGYKVYKTDCKNYLDIDDDCEDFSELVKDMIVVNCIDENTQFRGNIYFERITEDELQLLMFALGADSSFNLKLGGFRFCGLGECKVKVDKLIINGKAHNGADFAKAYENGYGKNYGKSIDAIRKAFAPTDKKR